MALVCILRSPSRMHGVYVFLILSKGKKNEWKKRPLDFLDIKLEETLEISHLGQFSFYRKKQKFRGLKVSFILNIKLSSLDYRAPLMPLC